MEKEKYNNMGILDRLSEAAAEKIMLSSKRLTKSDMISIITETFSTDYETQKGLVERLMERIAALEKEKSTSVTYNTPTNRDNEPVTIVEKDLEQHSEEVNLKCIELALRYYANNPDTECSITNVKHMAGVFLEMMENLC